MKMKIVAAMLLGAVTAQTANAQISQVSYASLTGTQLVTFDDVPGGSAPGTNYDAVFFSNGVAFAERFAGQTVANVGGFDQLGGAPAGALSLALGAPNQNLNVFVNAGSQVLTGLGPTGFPSFGAIGEGSFAALFTSDQSQFGFQLVGGDGGSAFLDFFRADGSLIQSIALAGLANTFYGFQRDGGINDIRGISIWNNDAGGIGFDNLKFDVRSTGGTVPEPATWAMMIIGFGLIGGAMRRKKAALPVLA